MAATMSVKYDFGGVDGTPASSIDIDAYGPPRLRFKLADNATIDTNNPMIIPAPATGPYYSSWKHIYLYCDAPDGNTINNVKLYSDGANSLGAGVDLKVGLQFPVKNSGSTAGYEVSHAIVGNTCDELVAGHVGITSSATIFGYTAGVGALAITISEAGAVINAAGETTNYVLLQLSVTDAAGAGTTATETFTFSYDEA